MDNPVEDGEGMTPYGHVKGSLRVLADKSAEAPATAHLGEAVAHVTGHFLDDLAEGDASTVFASCALQRGMAARVGQASDGS